MVAVEVYCCQAALIAIAKSHSITACYRSAVNDKATHHVLYLNTLKVSCGIQPALPCSCHVLAQLDTITCYERPDACMQRVPIAGCKTARWDGVEGHHPLMPGAIWRCLFFACTRPCNQHIVHQHRLSPAPVNMLQLAVRSERLLKYQLTPFMGYSACILYKYCRVTRTM